MSHRGARSPDDGRSIVPRRLRAQPVGWVLGRRVPVATGPVARLLGLALLPRERAGPGLLLPRCDSVHTFGMRFAIDVVFLSEDGRIRSLRPRVPPGRVVADRGADAVLELPAA